MKWNTSYEKSHFSEEETNPTNKTHKRVASYGYIIIKDCNLSLAQKMNTTKHGKNKVNTKNGSRKQQHC